MPRKKTMVKAARPAVLERVAHDPRPVKLDPRQRTLLNEALRRGEDTREQVEATVTAYGRWLLGAVFHDDAAAAVDPRTDNPVFRELVRRAGGPTLKISRRMLYVAIQLAARDKRIVDQHWQGLDAGRKELLLPLGTDQRLREGAQHVSKFNLTHARTREYVAEVLRENGKPRALRLTMAGLVARVQKLRETLGAPAVLRKVHDLRDGADPAERRKAADEIDRLRGTLNELAKALRKG